MAKSEQDVLEDDDDCCTSFSPSSESAVLVFFSPADFTALLFELPPPMIKTQEFNTNLGKR